jgi:hypothetical protein
MKFIKLPDFFVPREAEEHVRLASMSDEEIQPYQHPLQTCSECGYALCACGSCHHRGCSQDRECTA